MSAAAAEVKGNVAVPADAVVVTCSAPVNIAVIKYWGKKDVKLNTPVNSSLSGTIDPGTMQSRTTIVASKSYRGVSMTLNGKEVDINKRTQTVIAELQKRAGDFKADGTVLVAARDWAQYGLRIVSANNFPTAAGLASSASGFACLTKCLAELYSVREAFEGELTTIARQGSGSACRSLYGGFVKWEMGRQADGLDSKAVQVVPESHWPEMRVLILVVNKAEKKVSSTQGMQHTVATSPLMKYRAESVVPQRMADIERAIKERDFETFANITMAESNQFHATCLDTFPPIFYMNDTSRRIIEMVHEANELLGGVKVAYTFDAGPNAVLYLLDEHLPAVFNAFNRYFAPGDVTDPLNIAPKPNADAEKLSLAFGEKPHGLSVSRIIVSKVGRGAEILEKRHTFGQGTDDASKSNL